ncbi:peptidylprolyl isomerase [Fusobacterium animalis]|uniref:peptidylprolyl isomerase n=1 Tax=Fusobacterium animalis TaxID=76859 RepID=UPI0030CBF3CE
MIDYNTVEKYIGKKIKIKFTKKFLKEKNKKIIEEENKMEDSTELTQKLLKDKGLSSVNQIDFSEGILTRIEIESDSSVDEDYYILLDGYKGVYFSNIESIEEIK